MNPFEEVPEATAAANKHLEDMVKALNAVSGLVDESVADITDALAEVSKQLEAYEKMLGQTAYLRNPGDCHLCETERVERFHEENPTGFAASPMIVCPECGAKRCPKATWHDNPCSNSNAPGQFGSVYGSKPYKIEES